ncbi:MAG: aminoacyl-tRNA hydrolase [Fimbriimonadales bacterium]|nr:aminoacyl-tRNA hydrolase [Fimbriimonadales bacterium]
MKWFRRQPEPLLPPEWMVVGLGNPGPEYANTRHNVGFLVVEELARRHGLKLSKAKHRALCAQGSIGGVSVLLVKPLTFMNLSGEAVRALVRELGLPPERVLVVADDMALQLGRVRLKPKGGPGGHNGHKSIVHALGSQNYPRLKVGIGSAEPGEAVDHVLGKFRPDELPEVRRAVELAVQGVEWVLAEGVERAMNRVNPAGQQPQTSE